MTSRGHVRTKLLSRHFLASFHVCDTIEGLRIVRVPHMAKLLSKLIYSRVIAVSYNYNYSDESIRHKNRDIF